MVLQLLAQIILGILTILFGWLPQITTLPPIGGYDIDTALVNGVGFFYTYANAVWPVEVAFQGFLFLMGYYLLKMLLKFFLGHRAPGTH
jgi:hypothetical protein